MRQSASRVAVIGGGPSGSFFSYFLLQMSGRVGLDPEVDLYEPRDFLTPGPKGCNMCGGIVSESLVQSLAAEGIDLPVEVIQRRIDSYFLHMDVGSVRIETPLREKRIAAVHRGSGPRGVKEPTGRSFDAHLLDLTVRKGTNRIREKVEQVEWEGDRPVLVTQDGTRRLYDLVAMAVGINAPIAKMLDLPSLAYEPPKSTKAYICEFYLGVDTIKRYLGSSMHVFLLNLPRLDFAAIIPKTDYATVCLLGEEIDRGLVDAFLGSPEVRQMMPPDWSAPDDYCHCSPRISTASARRPYGERIVFIGDCGTTRLFKDGIGAAYRLAKAAAVTAVFQGVSKQDFERGFWPACSRIQSDNDIGKLVFWVTRQIQRQRAARRGLYRMVSAEQHREGSNRPMSTVLWDTFTGSAPYRSVLGRTVRPGFWSRFLYEIASGVLPDGRGAGHKRTGRRLPMATGASGLMGRKYADGEIIYRQGERGSCMYVVQGGSVEILQRKGEKEHQLAVLGDGDFFGEMALFGQEERTSTVRAKGEVWIFTLEKFSLLRRIHEDPSLAFRMLQAMAHRIQELESALTDRIGA